MHMSKIDELHDGLSVAGSWPPPTMTTRTPYLIVLMELQWEARLGE